MRAFAGRVRADPPDRAGPPRSPYFALTVAGRVPNIHTATHIHHPVSARLRTERRRLGTGEQPLTLGLGEPLAHVRPEPFSRSAARITHMPSPR